ncbi:MAG: sulfatase-like hydrolase/transferase, partial [Thermoanaerobaculales bacterium]|nr:sulfatase-like hydrolase/transferase [Thermoanaerobaculales bacterium]
MKQKSFLKRLVGAVAVCSLAIVLLMSCGGDKVEESSVVAGAHPIIVIALDGLRADALGSYGAPARTPAFDALAAESVRFEWAFTQAPQSQPSLATLFSGLYPTTNGLREPGDYMADEAQTLAETFGAAGYSTAAFVEGLPGGSDYGLAQGFDSYQTVSNPGVQAAEWMESHANENFLLVLAGWSNLALEQVNTLLEGSGQPEGMDKRVAEVLASRATDQPINFDEADLEWARAWYAARIQVIDSLLEGFLAEIRSLGLDNRATLVVLGSNGFALQENGDLFGESLYTSVSRVPVFIRLAAGADARSISKVIEVVDLMPTILDLTNQPVPAGVQGSSVLPILEGAGQPPYVAFGESPQFDGQRFVALGGMGMVSGIAGAGAEIFN